ncbi:MAG: NAD-dependent epimerase/dehydratase family protein [Proteobacteria bacterium]|jgi:2-alkyl-3-oxoalkanoate reductase|nr:NAD-dependent epimerase/dehydratase family protein [Pseudomonadota bacterium]
MRIFVTGATGFVGRTLVDQLNTAGHRVTALVLPEEETPNLNAEIRWGDITQPKTLQGLLHGHDAVVHLASAVGYGQNMGTAITLNVNGTRNVAEEALVSRVRRFIHMSSISVYGRVPGQLITEGTPTRKTGDPYGDTKIDAEELLSGLATRGHLDLTILRPTVIYGPGDRLFLPKLAQNLRSGRARLIGTGENTVDAVHVNDVASFINEIIDDNESFDKIYNLNNPANPSWSEFVALVADELGVERPDRHLPYPLALAVAGAMEMVGKVTHKEPPLTRYAVRVVGRQYHYDTTAAEQLGFGASMTLGDGIREVIAQL